MEKFAYFGIQHLRLFSNMPTFSSPISKVTLLSKIRTQLNPISRDSFSYRFFSLPPPPLQTSILETLSKGFSKTSTKSFCQVTKQETSPLFKIIQTKALPLNQRLITNESFITFPKTYSRLSFPSNPHSLYKNPVSSYPLIVPKYYNGAQFYRNFRRNAGNSVLQTTILGQLSQKKSLFFQQVRRYNKPYTDKEGTVHFRKRGIESWFPGQGGRGGIGQDLNDRQKKVLAFAVFFVGGTSLVYFTHLETVPYTRRKHCILWSPGYEKDLGENEFKQIKLDLQKSTLPPFHPEVLRVRKVATDVVRAALKGASTKNWGQQFEDESEASPSNENNPNLLIIKSEEHPVKNFNFFGFSKGEQKTETSWDPEGGKPLGEKYGELSHGGPDYAKKLEDDDKWIDKNRRRGLSSGSEGFMDHLKKLNWEVIVVDKPDVNAFCLPGGKIVVFTGLLKNMKTNEELATVLGHEVGHVVARHAMERMTTGLALVALQLIVMQFVNMPQLVGTVTDLVFNKPFSRMHEIEADRIGLLLQAAAGFDPRIAPSVYQKLATLEKSSEWAEYISTHPSGNRRAQLLQKTETMQEALTIYREKVAGKSIELFL